MSVSVKDHTTPVRCVQYGVLDWEKAASVHEKICKREVGKHDVIFSLLSPIPSILSSLSSLLSPLISPLTTLLITSLLVTGKDLQSYEKAFSSTKNSTEVRSGREKKCEIYI